MVLQGGFYVYEDFPLYLNIDFLYRFAIAKSLLLVIKAPIFHFKCTVFSRTMSYQAYVLCHLSILPSACFVYCF